MNQGQWEQSGRRGLLQGYRKCLVICTNTLTTREPPVQAALGCRGGLVLLQGLLWWGPGFDCAPEVAKSNEG